MNQMMIEDNSNFQGATKKLKWKLSSRENIIKYLRYFPLFLLTLTLSLGISYLYLRYTTPVYEVSSSIFIKSDSKFQPSGNDELSTLMFLSQTGGIDNEIEILKSNSLMQRVVKILDLECLYFAIGKVKSTNVYGSSPIGLKMISVEDSTKKIKFTVKILDNKNFKFDGDKTKTYQFGQIIHSSFGSFILSVNDSILKKSNYLDYLITWNTPKMAASSLLTSLQIKPITLKSDVLKLSYITDNTKMGEDILNVLMNEYNRADLEEKNIQASKTLDFINERIAYIGDELNEVENTLFNYRKKNNILNIESQGNVFLESIKETEQNLQKQDVKLEIVKMLSDYLRKSAHKYDVISTDLGLESLALSQLTTQFNALQIERSRQLNSSTIDNIFVKRLENDIENLRKSIIEELANLKGTIEIAKADIVKQNNAYQSKIKQIPAVEKGLLDISRQQGIKQELYVFLGQKREQTAITRASNISNSKIVDEAQTSILPKSPNRANVLFIAILLGLLLPILIIYLLDLLNDKITMLSDITNFSAVPILGEIGSADFKHSIIAVTKNDRGVIAEQFRILRTNLNMILKKDEKPVILITSSFSGEGKSFVAINLGAVVSLSDKKTVILEFDIRKPKIASRLGVVQKTGLTSFLTGHSDIAEIINKVENFDNLYVIPCGIIPPNPSELLLSDQMEVLFTYLKNNFDAIIIDSAPVCMVSDALTISKFANCSLYIVRQRFTIKRQVATIDEFYHTKKLPRMSVLVNDVNARTTGYYGYGNYGYGESYGIDIEEGNKQKRKSIWGRLFSKK
jgi:tyrosine-protein kinase Etk/Wzc